MAKQSTVMRAAGVAALLGLAACSGPPWTLNKSPNAIALRWYSDETSAFSADQLAELHCRSWGKSAELTADVKDGSDEIAKFRCR
jgi:hypothetical protein